jgi:LPS O-antigen subunit length determinant protein (WzzB/FepE family)
MPSASGTRKKRPTKRRPVSIPNQSTTAELDDILQKLHMHRRTAKELDVEIKTLQERALSIMDAHGIEKYKTPSNLTATRIQPHPVVIDPIRLRKRLGTAWRQVTTQVLDKGKLEAAIAAKEIDPVVVAECSEIKDGTPYITVKEK